MRRLRYSLAASLDGFISGPKGEVDWISVDASADFASFSNDFDTLLMGRVTYEITLKGPGPTMPGMETIVCSRTLNAEDHPNVTVASDAVKVVSALKQKPGKDIWLFGGGNVFKEQVMHWFG